MSDFKATPTTDLNMIQLLERYQINDEATLRTWAHLHGINGNRGFYSPREVDLIDHVHHHLHNLGMTIDEYQNLLNRRFNPDPSSSEFHSAQADPKNSVGTPTPNSIADSSGDSDAVIQQTSDSIEMLIQQYSEAIDFMGEKIADHFIEELDVSVMQHLAKKVQQRRSLNGQARPNRFLKAIQGVFDSKKSTLLVISTSEDSSLHMENTHRLG